MSVTTKAYLALIFICIVWGTTYLALRVGVMYYPPFLFAGVRQVVSGVILAAAALLINKKKDFSRANILKQMLVGFLMLTLGNGCVTWGEKTVESGVAALICSLMPMVAVMINLGMNKTEKLNWTIALGLFLGLLGVGLIFRQSVEALSNPQYLLGILALLVATSSWALGSIINKKNVNPVNPILNSGMQLFFGGLFMLLISPVVDNPLPDNLWQKQGVYALIYLIIFGSVLAYAAYMFILSKLPVGVATIYAYVNPLVAVVLGYFLMSEPLNAYTALAFISIATGVYVVNKGYQKLNKKQVIKQNAVSEEMATATT